MKTPVKKRTWVWDVAWAIPFGAWMVVAGVAAFAPDRLDVAVADFLPIRRDTLGALCFALSLGLFMIAARRRRRTDPVLRAIQLFGAAIVIYLGLNGVIHPQTMHLPLTHLLPWPSELVTLIAAGVGVLSARLLLRRKRYTS